MSLSLQTPKPLKTIHDKRLAYLVSLEGIYKEQGYSTRVDGWHNLLEVYEKGVIAPKTETETVIEKWID